MDRVVVVKLGGSFMGKVPEVRPFTFRASAVTQAARAIAASGVKVVVVHGGGAFGHPVAGEYGISSTRPTRSPSGVAETRLAMFDLDLRVCRSLVKGGLRPYAFSPFPLLDSAGDAGVAWIRRLVSESLTPVTFGDVVHDRGGFRVLSGDTIVSRLCSLLGAERCVFLMDREGVMDGERVVKSLDRETAARLDLPSSRDATGGIRGKVKGALEMAEAGTEVAFVSGFAPPEISKALKGLSFHGTSVKVPSRGKERRRKRS